MSTKGTRLSGEGERAARRGYRHQDRASARLAYEALSSRRLRWIGLADRGAGNVDDLVLGLADRIVAHQFKRSKQPTGFGLTGLLLGTSGEIARLASARAQLAADHPGTPVRIRYVTNDYPSTNDRLIAGDSKSTTADFLDEWKANRSRSLTEWQATRWQPVIEHLANRSKLTTTAFEAFWIDFDLVSGPDAVSAFEPGSDAEREQQIEDLADAIGRLVADNPDQDRWSRDELLRAIGWPDRFALRFAHDFPVGAWVQRNVVTEARLTGALSSYDQGYIGLIGPPGAGKSTLLARELRSAAKLRVVRYLAFVPGTAQGQGRGEADALYHDLTTQLAAEDSEVVRLRDDTLPARRTHFETMLTKAGDRFARDGVRTVVVVDGLDHVPREEKTVQSLLTALPLPHSIPQGVLFVLGTQRLDLSGMPPAVAQQAGSVGRRIEVTPLDQAAVTAMAAAAGLDTGIDRARLYHVSGGHALVMRYLIERLLMAGDVERDAILDGSFGEGGDLEAVYQVAWRWVEQSADPAAVKRVLALIAHAQGPIEPEALARAEGETAVEAALAAAGHLLLISPAGWTPFHNSFRLFVQRQPVLRFGAPHPNFAPEAIYRRLGTLVDYASPASPQRWLAFRYAYLASDLDEAFALATRRHFVGQYTAGRDAPAIMGDLSDCYRILEARPDAAKLFEVMLAQDEIDRRASVMESASGLVDAYIALKDVDAALAAVEELYEDGQQWLVVDALTAAGRIEEARALFGAHTPFSNVDDQIRMGITGELETRLAAWASRAVLFLDASQIERELAQVIEIAEDQFRAEFAAAAGLAIAVVFFAADPTLDLDDLCEQWNVEDTDRAQVAIEGAEASYAAGEDARVEELLTVIADDPHLAEMHDSWPLAAASLARRVKRADLFERLLVHAPQRGLGSLPPHNSERLGDYIDALVRGVAVRVAGGVAVAPLEAPASRNMAGIQRHLVAVATAIGEVRAGQAMPASAIERQTASALRFFSSIRWSPSEDDVPYYRLEEITKAALAGLFDLAESAGVDGDVVARALDASAIAKGWSTVRRFAAVRAFMIDCDGEAATVRLEQALADIEFADPREEVAERARFAADFAEVGASARARELLVSLRQAAFGVYLAAKKDGQYELWIDLLRLANASDPAGRRDRSRTMLHLVEGLEDTEGSGMGRRIVRQVLYEMACADVATAGEALAWASAHGQSAWDGVVDAELRGLIARDAARCRDAMIVWGWLCLPWYAEPHGSTTSFASFLTEVVAACPAADLPGLETDVLAAIQMLARDDSRLKLLHILESAFGKCGGSAAIGDAVVALTVQTAGRDTPHGDDADPRNRSYETLTTLDDVDGALAEELAFQALKSEGRVVARDSEPSWNLKSAVARLVGRSAWADVEAFAARRPVFMLVPDIALAAARVAVAAGSRDAAERLLEAGSGGDRDREGWAWPSDPGTLRRHQVRHLLGLANAHAETRGELLHDLAARRYAVAGLLWSTDDIFPLLFEDVPWPELWTIFEEQLRTTRDFARGCLLNEATDETQAANDDALLVALFLQAFAMEVTVLGDSATRAALTLLDHGREAFFTQLVDRLLDQENGALLAADLLDRAAEIGAVRAIIAPRLNALARHADFAVVAVALSLSVRWETPVTLEPDDLPAFYALHLPPDATPDRMGAADARTGGMVLDDPLGWTQEWAGEVAIIAVAAGVSEDHVRRRAAQLIDSWGGIARFGHAGTKALEARLARLGFKLHYRRPHVRASLQALRNVSAELFHAGRLGPDETRQLARILLVDPGLPSMPQPVGRPDIAPQPAVPRLHRENERQAWLDAVTDDVAKQTPACVLAETSIIINRDGRNGYVRETFASASLGVVAKSGIDETRAALPVVAWRGGRFGVTYDRSDANPGYIAIYRQVRIERLPTELLVLCPYASSSLGWHRAPGSIDCYLDSSGERMAWTEWWRDGLPQPVDEDERSAEGQRVCLSTAGLAAFGGLQIHRACWRWIVEGKEPGAVRTARSDGPQSA